MAARVIHRAILNITGIPSLKGNRTFMTLLLLAFVMYISKFLKTSIMCGMASLKGFYVPVNSILYRAKVGPSFAVMYQDTHLQNGSSTLEMTLNLVPAYSFTAIQLSSIWPCREQQLMAGCWLGAQLISRPGPGVMILNSYILLLQSCALCWLHCNGHQIMYTPPAGFGFIMSSVCL